MRLYSVAPYSGGIVSFSGEKEEKPKNRFQPGRRVQKGEDMSKYAHVPKTPEKGITQQIIEDVVDLVGNAAKKIGKKFKK